MPSCIAPGLAFRAPFGCMLFDVCAPAAVASAIANAKVRQFSFRALIAELLFKSRNGDAGIGVAAQLQVAARVPSAAWQAR
jgi:hypothetical protein